MLPRATPAAALRPSARVSGLENPALTSMASVRLTARSLQLELQRRGDVLARCGQPANAARGTGMTTQEIRREVAVLTAAQLRQDSSGCEKHRRRKRLSSSFSSTPCAAAVVQRVCRASKRSGVSDAHCCNVRGKGSPLLRALCTHSGSTAGAQQQPARRARILPNTPVMKFHRRKMQQQQ